MLKFDIINGLARARGFGRYLEICTPTTGVRFGRVDPDALAVRHRLIYRCPESYDDGLDITLRTTAGQSHEMLRALQSLLPEDQRYDLIFVDPFHDYAAGITDLHGALCLLRPGGILVVHDCNPTDPDSVGSEYRDGAWCGVTYQAFIDFALAADVAGYCVVDCDYGCGVVFGRECPLPEGVPLHRPDQAMAFEWNVARLVDATRYAFFDRNRTRLLNLVSPYDFADACGLPPPEPEPASDIPNLSQPPEVPDPGLRVMAGEVELPMEEYRDGWHRFAVPDGATQVSLISPSVRPSDASPGAADTRRLGLAVGGIRFGTRSINLGDACLSAGWHSDEAAGGYPWRWTDGAATLRLPRGTAALEVFTVIRPSPPAPSPTAPPPP